MYITVQIKSAVKTSFKINVVLNERSHAVVYSFQRLKNGFNEPYIYSVHSDFAINEKYKFDSKLKSAPELGKL